MTIGQELFLGATFIHLASFVEHPPTVSLQVGDYG